MKPLRLFGALTLVLGLAACNLSPTTPTSRTNTPTVTLDPTQSFVEGQLVVGYQEGVDPAKVAALLGATVNTNWPEINAALLDLPAGLSVNKAEATAKALHGLRYVEPNKVFWTDPLPASGVNPAGLSTNQLGIDLDPAYDKQWMHRQMNTLGAWQQGATGEGIRIGVHDTLVDVRHPDLAANVFFPGFDGFDSSLIMPDTPYRGEENHGTAVAGTAAAVGGNDLGGLGVAYGADIVALAIDDPESGGLLLNAIVNAAIFAVDGPDGEPGGDDRAPGTDPETGPYVHIVNMSWGSSGYDQIVKDTMDYMLAYNVTLVTSAGNTPTQGFAEPAWHPGLISVAATRPTDERTGFSNRGLHLEVAAPGEDIWTTTTRNCAFTNSCDPASPENAYIFISGTSFSSPATAGAAALILDASATRDANGNITDINLDAAQVRRILETTAFQPNGGEFNVNLGYGIVDAEAAVDVALDESQWPQPGGTLVVEAVVASDPNIVVPKVGLTLVPLDVTGEVPAEYTQTSDGILFPDLQGIGLYQEVNPGRYQLLASGPHQATFGIPVDTFETDVTITPGGPDDAEVVVVPLDITPFQDTFEPNDSVGEAAPVEVGTTALATLYNPETGADTDLYAIQVEAGESYRVNLETVAGNFDTFLRVLGADGTTVIAENDNNQASNLGTDSLVTFEAPETGTVYAEVTELTGANTPFNLYAVDVALFIGSETEPNGTAAVSSTTINTVDLSAAQSVPLGAALDAAIGEVSDEPETIDPDPTDADIFAVEVEAGTTIVADTETKTSGAPDTLLALYNADGEQVAFNDDFTGRESRVFYTAQEGGTYYVVVVAFDAAGTSGTTGTYGLIINSFINPPTETE